MGILLPTLSIEMSNYPIYHLTWDGPIVPKARPRVFEGEARMPEHYKDMKDEALQSFSIQWSIELGNKAPIPWRVRPYVFLWGKHRRSGDVVDNVPGTLYDALVQAGVLKADSAMWCPGSVHDLVHSNASPRTDILLAPWMPFSQSLEQIKEIMEWLRINKLINGEAR